MKTKTTPAVWAVVPAFNRCQWTVSFARRFSEIAYPNKHLVVVDDNSNDNTALDLLFNFPQVHVLSGDGNLWWAGATNLGVDHAIENGAEFILTINDDAVFDSDFLTPLVETALANEDCFAACTLLSSSDYDTVWALGSSIDFDERRLMRLNYAGESWRQIFPKLTNPLFVSMLPGNGVLIPRSAFCRVGRYDDNNMPQYHADSDFSLRARKAGYGLAVTPRSILYNHIVEAPLVGTFHDLLFSKKSDLYWPALSTFFERHVPDINLAWVARKIYADFTPPEINQLNFLFELANLGKYITKKDVFAKSP